MISNLTHRSEEYSLKFQSIVAENIPTACARVEALRSHGYRQEALRLAVSIVRTLKKHQSDCQNVLHTDNTKPGASTSSASHSHSTHCNNEGWIGHPLDPIGSLFDTLAEVSLTPESKPLDSYYGSLTTEISNNNSSNNTNTNNSQIAAILHDDTVPNNTTTTSVTVVRERPRYQHIEVPGARDHSETYLSLALEAGLIGLGQQRLMPPGFYAQEKACKQEDRMITKLQDIELDSTLVSVLRKQTMTLLDGGPFSGLGSGIHPESVPMHTFAKYLFNALLNFDHDLSYNVGLRAMRYSLFCLIIAICFSTFVFFKGFQYLKITTTSTTTVSVFIVVEEC